MISIIMRSKNDVAVISATLHMLFSQTIQDFELINVDSGSTDGTLDIIREYNSRLIQIPSHEYIPGKVLNDMARLASGEVLVFLNSDATPADEYWLERLINALDNETTAASFSRQLPREDAYPLVRFDYLRGYPDRCSPRMDKDFISFAAVAIRRVVWETHPFYEQGLAEDQAWAHQINLAGLTIRYVPDSSVVHSHNLTLKQLYIKEYLQGGVARVFIYKEQPALMLEIFRFAKSLLRDLIFCLKNGYILSIFYCLPFRAAQHLGFYRGRKAGWKKLRAIPGKDSRNETVHLLREYTT